MRSFIFIFVCFLVLVFVVGKAESKPMDILTVLQRSIVAGVDADFGIGDVVAIIDSLPLEWEEEKILGGTYAVRPDGRQSCWISAAGFGRYAQEVYPPGLRALDKPRYARGVVELQRLSWASFRDGHSFNSVTCIWVLWTPPQQLAESAPARNATSATTWSSIRR